MTNWTFVREIDGEYTIGKNGMFYNDVVIEGVDPTIHAIQWRENTGDVERRDVVTGKITANEDITSLSSFPFIETGWDSARAAHKTAWTAERIAAKAEQGIVLTQADADAEFENEFPA